MELSIIQSKIHEIRGFKVILDFDLAEMYQVDTKNLNLSVKRNIRRFPSDFMFQLESSSLDSSNIKSSSSKRFKLRLTCLLEFLYRKIKDKRCTAAIARTNKRTIIVFISL